MNVFLAAITGALPRRLLLAVSHYGRLPALHGLG